MPMTCYIMDFLCRVKGLQKEGVEVGIDFTGKCDRLPNTLQAHALLEYAKEHDGGSKQNEMAEALFQVQRERTEI